MNKRDTIFSFVVFLIVLFAIKSTPVLSDGCCFLNYTDVCYEGNEADCAEDEGEFFDNEKCADVKKCWAMCCCEALPNYDPYPIREGTCDETFRGSTRSVLQEECDLICEKTTSEIPLCNEGCEINTKDCVGRNARIVDVDFGGRYYCWENDETYNTQQLCNDNCRIIGQCDEGEITESCYCGDYLYSSGFCCWDGTYDSDAMGANCPEANNCESYPEEGPYYECCDGCLDEGFTYWMGNYDGSIDKCPQDKPRCCQKCAPDLEDCCDYDWQCDDKLGYMYSSCSPPNVACGAECNKPQCVIGEKVNEANFDAMCICEEEYYCTGKDPSVCTNVESRYCCPDGLSALPCEADTFDLTGYVYNGSTAKGVPSTFVSVESLNHIYSTMTDESGEYFIGNIVRGSGQFNVLVIKWGYYPGKFIVEYPLSTRQIEREDFNIIYVENVCDAADVAPVETFNAGAVRGEKKVSLTWEPPISTTSEIIGYYVGRDQDFDLGTFFTRYTSFIDNSVEWDETYTYDISVLYASGAISQRTFDSIIMGTEDCEGISDGEEFCLDNSRKKCDENNNLAFNRGCLFGYSCFGPKEDGTTECKEEKNCREKGNPFGLFCTGAVCLENDDYCYYDYSDTIVDESKNCSTVIDCYGYRSKDACEKDNCEVNAVYLSKENSPCEWYYTFEEFGKGICYDEDYDGTEHCGLCNKDSTVFYNVNCDQNVCTRLGACYSNELSCESCFGNINCGDFDNEASCINAHSLGSTNVSIWGCPASIIRSDDACGLGACKWGDPDGDGAPSCFKDANDDNVLDCTRGEVGCEDFEPFSTQPQPDIPKMNAEGYGIHLYLTEGGAGDLKSFYFCIDEGDLCCPASIPQELSYDTREIIINPLQEMNMMVEEGGYFLRYYSIDSNDNVEEVKSTGFFVDSVKPEVTFGHRFYSENGYNYTEVMVVADECVSCQYELNGLPEPVEHNFDTDGSKFFAIFKELDEGNYIFTTVCEDDVHNSVRNDYSFYIDNIHEISIGYPNGGRLNTEEVNFHLTTKDNSTCILEAADASGSGIPYNPLLGEPVKMDKAELIKHKLYNYTKTLTLKRDVSYIVKATCVPVIPGKEDSGFFHFTIDKQAPITSTDFDFDAWHKKEGDLVTINFGCNDPKINGFPGQAGCKETYLCTGLNCHASENNYQLIVNGEYQTNVNGLYVSYFSVDKLGNKEDRYTSGHYNQQIKIDGDAPIISITLPTEQDQFTSRKRQTIKISVEDGLSGIDYVEVRVEEIDAPRRKNIFNATRQGRSNIYSLDVDLYDGQNLITATACDKALNCVQDNHQIYLDVYPPYIEEIIITDSDLDLDKDNVFEYRENLSFAVKIEDKFLHLGNKLRYGAGVDPERVSINILGNAGVVVASAIMVAGGENYYYQNITEELPVGQYTAKIEAYDYYGGTNSKTASFAINDTNPPRLELSPGILPQYPIKKVYFEDYHITGFTEPLVNIDVSLYDELGAGPIVYLGQGADVSEPKPEFMDVPVDINPFTGTFPAEGDNEIFFAGDYMRILSTKDYIEFSGHKKVPKYRITGKWLVFGSKTKITIEPPLEEDIDIDTASAYTSSLPSGWFDIPVVLQEGVNVVHIKAAAPTGPSSELFRLINYSSSGLNIIQKSPAIGQVLYYNDFYPAQSIVMRVTTDFSAKCNIVNEQENSVAKVFDYEMLSSNGREHSFILDSSDCAPTGKFCYINDDQGTGIIYHKYTIKCSPTKEDMASDQKDICFGVTTYRNIRGPEGQNICGGVAEECIDNDFPSTCAVSISNCAIGNQITESCFCKDGTYDSGYCCLEGYSAEPCAATCSYGQITRECDCGGIAYSSGYCCNGRYQTTQCNPQGTVVR